MSPLQISSNDSFEDVLRKTTVARQWLDVSEDSFTSSTAGKKVEAVLRISAHIPGTSPAVVDVFEPAFKRLSVMSGGAIAVEAHWGGSLHNEREGITALCSGLTDMCPVYSAWDPGLFPAAQALSLPFMFDSAELATQVSEVLYQRYFKDDFERQGIFMGRMVATSDYNLFSRSPVRALEDLAGQKVACSDGVESDIFSALGAIPVKCSTPEAKNLFFKNEVFAVSISDSAAHTVGLYQQAAFRTSANLVRVNLEYGLSQRFYLGLSQRLKVILNEWLRGLAQAGAQLFYGLAGAKARAAFKASNMEFITLSTAEQARWRQQVSGVERAMGHQLTSTGYPADEMLVAIRSESEKYASWSADQLMSESLRSPLQDLLPDLLQPDSVSLTPTASRAK